MKDFFQNYLDNKCTEKELQTLIDCFTFSEQSGVLNANMKEHWENVQTNDEIPDLTGTLYKIHYTINSQEERVGKKRILYYLTRVAAIFLIPLSIAFFFALQKNNSSNILQTVSTPLASKTHFTLPDGSVVWLNSGSSVTFAKNFGSKQRELELNGEAFFDVKKGEIPFVVDTKIAKVKVLGTAFNVMAYNNENPAVTLERGKVFVSSASGDSKVLTPGEQAIIDPLSNNITVQQVDTEIYSSWVRNQLIFRNETLSEVVKRLERWYNITIEIDDKFISDKKLTATIEYESITEVMDLLEITLSLKYEYNKNERKLIIKPVK